jgi:hypothetical protein
MRFNLNARWSIETEINQVILIQKRIALTGKSKGQEIDGRRWFWNNFEDALEGLIDRDIDCLEKVEEIVGRIKELKAEIRTMLRDIENNASAHRTEIKMPKLTTYRHPEKTHASKRTLRG